MLEASTNYKIGAVFEIITASLLGAVIPFLYIKRIGANEETDDRDALNNRPVFFILKAMTCGVIIGVSLLHLAPDADENLGEEYDYPVTFVLMGTGIILNLICEQVALYIISTTKEEDITIDSKLGSNSVTKRLLQDVHDEGNDNNSHRPHHRSMSRHSVDYNHSSRMDSCEVGAVVAVFANANDPKALLKAYVLEGAIAVHSIIMGISLGSMQNDELSNIKILMIAYAVHQFLEGISLGCAMTSTNLSSNKITGLVLFFACTLPLGIVIGMIITFSLEDSHSQEIVEGFANGLAAGILVYVSMVEMLAEEFSHPTVKDDYLLKSKMIVSMICGLVSMCVLAIWA